MARSRNHCRHGNAIMRSLLSADAQRCHGSTAMRYLYCCDSCCCYNVKHNSVFTCYCKCPNLTKSVVSRHIFVTVLINADSQTDMKLKGRLSPLTRAHVRSPNPNWWFLFPILQTIWTSLCEAPDIILRFYTSFSFPNIFSYKFPLSNSRKTRPVGDVLIYVVRRPDMT